MCQTSQMAPAIDRVDVQQRRAVIHAAAIREFSSRGFAGTSMANIADAAGISRPGLYEYFDNKADIFASAFEALVDDCVDKALEALNAPVSMVDQINGMLQHFDGDMWEQMSASPHAQEILSIKNEYAADVGIHSMQRLHNGLVKYLRRTGAPASCRTEWVEMLKLSPKGFKFDQPSIEVFRRRLITLARAVASDIEATVTQ